jgi:hypothetical protein
VIDALDGSGYWGRDVVFPCFPFPGLHVGPHRVRAVHVCQGDLDGTGATVVELDAADPHELGEILIRSGWAWTRDSS